MVETFCCLHFTLNLHLLAFINVMHAHWGTLISTGLPRPSKAEAGWSVDVSSDLGLLSLWIGRPRLHLGRVGM